MLDLTIDAKREKRDDLIIVLQEIIQGIKHGKDFGEDENMRWQVSEISD